MALVASVDDVGGGWGGDSVELDVWKLQPVMAEAITRKRKGRMGTS
jgi:hypothetical protein